MKTIKGRILLAFLTLCLLIAPFLIFSYNSVQKIDDVKKVKEQIAIFDINRLRAVNKFNRFLQSDTKIDSFYIQKASANLNSYIDFITIAKKSLKKTHTSEYPTNNIVLERINRVESDLKKIETLSEKIISLYLKRGFRDFGMEGIMRQKIHNLESNTKGITLAENLSLRRREKDYFLRNDLQYVEQLNKESNTLINRLSSKKEDYSETIQILKDYQGIFNEIVAIQKVIGNEKTGAVNEIHLANLTLDLEIRKLYEVIEVDLNNLENSVKSYLILFFSITILFAIVFAFFFSDHMSRPILQLIENMDTVSEQQFKGDFNFSTNLKIKELKILTKKYNQLVEKIQAQIGDLHTSNNELYALNVKLEESEQELKEASLLKDKFFSIISHDLRGHTGNVLSLAKILKDEKDELSDKEKSVFVKYLVDSSQNLQLLLDNLLNWAKTQMNDHEISKKSFNINKLIKTNIELFKDNAYRKKVKMVFEDINSYKAYADKDMVDFIIRNLLSNALKFTRNDDTITVEITQVDDYLKIDVNDTGIGMSQNQIEQLLHSEGENFTTKGTENEVGTGLGFSICKDFVKRNNGKIEITSTEGQGSSFSFTIPISLTKGVFRTAL